jgi:Chaperone of endosialidase
MGFVVGSLGTPGAAGADVFTSLVADFTMPPAGSVATAELYDARGFPPGLIAFIENAGYVMVVSRDLNTDQIDVRNLGYEINRPPGTVAPTDSEIVGSGPQGIPGTAGWTILAHEFVMDAVGVQNAASVRSNDGFAIGVTIYIETLGYFRLENRVGIDLLMLSNTGARGNAPVGTIAPIDTIVQAAGIPLSGYYAGGLPGQPLVKQSGVDFDTRWGGDMTAADLTVNNISADGLTLRNDGQGVNFFGGIWLRKVIGTNMVLRANGFQIEDTSGANRRSIVDTTNGDARYVARTGSVMSGNLVLRSTGISGNADAVLYLQNSYGQGIAALQATMTGYTGYGGAESSLYLWSGNGGYGWNWFMRSNTGPSTTFNGTVSAAQFLTISDSDLKEDITPVDPAGAAEAFDLLQPVRFRWKPQEVEDPLAAGGRRTMPLKDPDRVYWGFIADDIQAIVPDAVYEDAEGMLSYDPNSIIAVTVSKVQQLDGEMKAVPKFCQDLIADAMKPVDKVKRDLTSLERRVKTIETREIEALEKRIAELKR